MRTLAILSFVLLTSCASGALPPERCTPSYQRAYLSSCELALEEACALDSRACLPSDSPTCKDALELLCPEAR